MEGSNLIKTLRGKTFTIAILVASIGCYILAGSFEYTAKPGRLGPDFWPKAMLLLIMAMSVLELAAAFFRGGAQGRQEEESPGQDDGVEEEKKQRYPVLLIAGMAITVGFVLLVDILGFALTTFLYLAGFMYLGRYRRPVVILVSSLLGTLFLVLVFVRLVYVSLPQGIPPFDVVTNLLYTLLGIS